MMCDYCKKRPATQRELLGAGGNFKEVNFSFADLCKTCSLMIGYDQNTVTSFIEFVQHMKGYGAKLNLDGHTSMFPDGKDFIKSIVQFNTEKSYLELSIKNMLEVNKGIFLLNLLNGVQAIKSELYVERSKNPGYLAQDYPLKDEDRADYVVFKALEDIREYASYKNYVNIDYIVKLIHLNARYIDPVDDLINVLMDDALNLFLDQIPQVYYVIVLTQIENPLTEELIQEYQFLKEAKSNEEMYLVNDPSLIDRLKIQLKLKLDRETIYVSETERIDDTVDVRLHFFICGPFRRGRLFNSVDNDIYGEKLPIQTL